MNYYRVSVLGNTFNEIIRYLKVFYFVFFFLSLAASPSIETASENYPLIITQKSGKKVPIVHAYAYTKYLGRIFLEFDDNGEVISADGNLILLNSPIPKGITFNKYLHSYRTGTGT